MTKVRSQFESRGLCDFRNKLGAECSTRRCPSNYLIGPPRWLNVVSHKILSRFGVYSAILCHCGSRAVHEFVCITILITKCPQRAHKKPGVCSIDLIARQKADTDPSQSSRTPSNSLIPIETPYTATMSTNKKLYPMSAPGKPILTTSKTSVSPPSHFSKWSCMPAPAARWK